MNKKILLILILVITLIDLRGIHSTVYYYDEDFQINTFYSTHDQNQDGIDDQSEILYYAKEYVSKKPKYKSKYYATGYPDDDYGVCTDVIGYALLHTGYDLKTLVHEDILENRDDYDIETVDENIDFRRVKNFKVYFDHHFLSLSLDVNDISTWQGGDIVVFKNHIGIISDKRNENGIPYVIHHSRVFQFNYEEDILENRNDIIGHYRVSI